MGGGVLLERAVACCMSDGVTLYSDHYYPPSGGEPLGHALVGEAIHAELAVAFGSLAEKPDGLGAVASFVAEGVELALGVAASAHVLNHNVIPMPREPRGVRIDDGRGDIATIGLAHQQCWPGYCGLVGGWIVVV